jgi:hypothetical protein
LKRLIPIICLMALLSACGKSQSPRDSVLRHIERVERGSHQYVYKEKTKDLETEVRGRVEDTIRHSEILLVEDATVMERVIRDDVMAIKVSLPDLVPNLNTADPADIPVANALRSGQWVIDPAGAPAVDTSVDVEGTGLGQDPLVDAAEVFQYMRLALRQSVGVVIFNPDAIEYQSGEDPFPAPKKEIGEERLDLLRPPLPTRAGGQLPGVAPFRKMSFYVNKGRLIRVLEKIDLEGHEDLKRARQTGRNRFHLELLRDLRAGRGPEVIRNREMSFELLSQGQELTIDPPIEGLTGNLRVLFAPKKQPAAAPPQLPEGVTNPLEAAGGG